jgi:hypothetical protein
MVAEERTFYSAPMNHEHPCQPAESCLRRSLAELKTFARREPGQAMAAAVGAGLLINLLPTRWVAGTAAVVGALLVRPVLLSLGVTKAMELCCKNSSTTDRS